MQKISIFTCNNANYLFLRSLAGEIQQILQSDWFWEQAYFPIRAATASEIRRVYLFSLTN